MSAPRAVALLCLGLATVARAQEFAPASPAPFEGSALALLTSALAPPTATATLESAYTSWWGVPELGATALALGGHVGGLVGAAGVARFGDPALGWHAVGAALGVAREQAGANLVTTGRQDRDRAARMSLTAGGGAWLAVAPGLRAWASAPQLWSDGSPPPLERPLETGIALDASPVALWLGTTTAPSRDSEGDRRFGLALRSGGACVWAEGLAPPWRARAGVRLQRGAIGIEASFETHPVLGETTHLSLSLAGVGAPTP